jgi:hypothetical protein
MAKAARRAQRLAWRRFMTTLSPADVLRQHADLRAVTCAVLLELEATPERDPRNWGAEVADVLGEWQRQLTTHFAFEEENGLFDLLRASDDPARAVRLLGQHGAFRQRLARLQEQARGLTGVAGAGAFHAELRRLVEDVETHESEENALAVEVLEKGAGVVD